MVFWRKKPQVGDDAWNALCDEVPIVAALDAERRARLRPLTEQFLRAKTFEACGGIELTDAMKLRIAAEACVPILQLGLDAYRGFSAILVYPDEFRSRHAFEDESGLVTEEDRPLTGEAWSDGPVVLSWADVESAGDGYNVVVHECAHKIDMLTGDEDGVPPLAQGMSREQWGKDFAAARDDLARREERGEETPIDPYAAENEAEGFAVFSEVFFDSPALLAVEYPKVYDWLVKFYRW